MNRIFKNSLALKNRTYNFSFSMYLVGLKKLCSLKIWFVYLKILFIIYSTANAACFPATFHRVKYSPRYDCRGCLISTHGTFAYGDLKSITYWDHNPNIATLKYQLNIICQANEWRYPCALLWKMSFITCCYQDGSGIEPHLKLTINAAIYCEKKIVFAI